jgi:hypothetical protein
MNQYLLSMYQPDGDLPRPDVPLTPDGRTLIEVMRDVNLVSQDMKAAGAWVFAGGLHPVSTATVVRLKKDGEIGMTDGPFAEGKEHIGGFTVIKASDLDAALEWAGKLARATTLPVEVRPFHHSGANG